MKKKIVIFGATGNTGTYVTEYAKRYFNNEEYEIIAVGRKVTDVFEKMGVRYYSADITKQEDFAKLPTENVYALICLAARIPSYMSNYDGKAYLETNVMGMYNMLEYARINKADRVIYTQTVFDISLSVCDGEKIDPYTKRNFSFSGDHAMYVISKNTAVDLLEHYHQEYGIKKFVFRLPTIYNYSSYQYYFPNGKKTMRPIYQMINKAIKGEDIECWGNPKYAKDMVYVDDFAQMLCLAVLADRDAGMYNVGTGIPVTLEEEIKTIIDVFGDKNKSKIIYKPEKKSGGGFLMDIQNAKDELGYEPQYDCKKLLETYKKEMSENKYTELRMQTEE